MIQATLLLVHLLGLALALVPIIILDLRIIMILVKGRIRVFDRRILQRFRPTMRSGLALVCISCALLGVYYAVTSAHLLLQGKYLFIVLSAGVLTVDSILIEKFFSQWVYRNVARPDVPSFCLPGQLKVTVRSAAFAVQPHLVLLIDRAKTSSRHVAAHVMHLVQPFQSGETSDDSARELADRRHDELPKFVISHARHAFINVGAFSLIINLLMLTTSLY